MQASVGPYVCDFVQKYLTQKLGISQRELERGGYVIQTTLDPKVQAMAQKELTQRVPIGNDRRIGGAAAGARHRPRIRVEVPGPRAGGRGVDKRQ